MRSPASHALAYGATLACVALSLLVVLLIQPEIAGRPATLLFVPAVIVAAALGGALPGLIASGASVVGAAIAIARAGGFDTASTVDLIVLGAIGLASSWFGERLLRARADAAARTAEVTEQSAFLQSVLDTVPDAIMVIDDRGLLLTYSPAAKRLFGYDADEVLGRNVSMLMPSPYRDHHDAYIERYLKTGERRIIGIGRVVVGQRKDGTTFPMELAVAEMRAGSGRYFTGFVRDVTERQRTEARLHDLQTELIHVSRLTAMGEMASALAHELNQPLSAIANYLRGSRRLIDRGDADPGVLGGALDKAADQALRAGDIIHRLRDFVAKGEGEPLVERVGKLVEEATALALVGAKELGVSVRYALDPEADFVLADRVQIQQVLVNLIRNAVDAMEGTQRRVITIASAPAEGGFVEISVRDTGIGIPSEVAERLFQPFFTTKPSGMGVGLSICRTIVEAHGGRIAAEAAPGGGTIFRFTLRAAPSEVHHE
ncbi:MAG: PAS domain S-box protein [Bauldia sp.]|nr:PAS domain S-box protein [Bauldia sp.]